MSQNRPDPRVEASLEQGFVALTVPEDLGQAGDEIAAFAADDLLGTALLRPALDGSERLSARIALSGPPHLMQPVQVRFMNLRTGGELGPGMALGSADAGPAAPAADMQEALERLAELRRRVEEVAAEQTILRRRLDHAEIFGRERLMLDRLDLFYLLLSDRIDRLLPRPEPAPPSPQASAARRISPAEVEGVGLYALETDGASEWRWFGPNVTLMFRGAPQPVARILLFFHGFGLPDADGTVQAWLQAVPVAATRIDLQDGRHALEIIGPAGTSWPDGTVILHLSFSRWRSGDDDPRLLSAVFSGAELFPTVE
jgi:hypothetical protein